MDRLELDLGIMLRIILLHLLLLPGLLLPQDGAGPEIPIILEHADSIVGKGAFESSVRTFYGNVRFQQGNVTGRCDRAIHNTSANVVELFGNVVIMQGALTMRAPEVRYNGNRYLAVAPKGVRVEQRGQIVDARKGEYSTTSHIAKFYGDVVMRDDTTRINGDTMVVDRDADTMVAVGNVVGFDSTDNAWFESDRARRDATSGELMLVGNAQMWNWDDDADVDTLYVSADTLYAIRSEQNASRSMDARGRASMIRGNTSARAGSITYTDVSQELTLRDQPYVWSDSMAFAAGAITATMPARRLESIMGVGKAILISKVPTIQTERYDQIAGDVIDLAFEQDSLRSILARGSAQSVTFRGEGSEQDGLAKVACDSIRAAFDQGQLSDVFWLGGIAGEHHPEQLVTGREQQFLLPSFQWRSDRPVRRRPRTQILR
ncbi:MAG: hypothetical protein RLZZ273_2 [Bacteroidota bacterium]